MASTPNPDRVRPAVAAAIVAAEGSRSEMLESIVEVARAICGAAASSILLADEESGDLEFRAVAGEGAGALIGMRVPAGTGIAGWVLSARQPVVVDDVGSDARFAQEVAQETGYLPRSVMAAPLLRNDRAIGVLEVLDAQRANPVLGELDMLGLFANQAAIALDVVQRGVRAREVLEDGGDELALVTRLAAAADALEGERRRGAMELVAALERLLRA